MQSRMLLRPDATTNELIGATLARASRLYQVEVFGFVFASNHFHLMIRAREHWRIARFMQFLQSNIARKVGRWVQWTGRFFSRRYSAEPIVDDEALVERLTYILAHGVKEGLVTRCRDWPGLSALQMLKSNCVQVFRWRDWTKRWFNHRDEQRDIDHFGEECPMSEETLQLAVLPAWQNLDERERQQRLARIERDIDTSASTTVLGVTGVMAQAPHSAPRRTDRSPRPKCHASTLELWKSWVGRYRDFRRTYAAASAAWHAGRLFAAFPSHCFRPPVPLTLPG
jgi:REP element-mobilizing transposase RayT